MFYYNLFFFYCQVFRLNFSEYFGWFRVLYSDPENYAKDMEIFNIIKSLSPENKATILDLANKLRNK